MSENFCHPQLGAGTFISLDHTACLGGDAILAERLFSQPGRVAFGGTRLEANELRDAFYAFGLRSG